MPGGSANHRVSGCSNPDFSGDNHMISVLILLASDVLAGVVLMSVLRSFLRSHISLVEFSTGVEVDVRRLERPEEPTSPITITSSPQAVDDYRQQPLSNTPFIVEARGLKNRGQTCYANSVLQALASLEPLCAYLESRQRNASDDCGQESIASILLRTLRHVNGHHLPQGSNTTGSSFLSSFRFLFTPPFPPGDAQRVMDMVAVRYRQFRSRDGAARTAGTREQQDCHEFFSALIDVLSEEELEEGGRGGGRGNSVLEAAVASRSERGLACCGSDEQVDGELYGIRIDERKGQRAQVRAKSESQFGNGMRLFSDDPEEKKHDENNTDDTTSNQFVPTNYCNQGQVAQKVEKENLTNSSSMLKGHRQMATRNTEAAGAPGSAIGNPFDGWSGSTIKCASCFHVHPIRSAPFLALSLPIVSIQSEFLEDFLAAEYGGFASAERVSDVQCFSCAIKQKIEELEEEEMLLLSAVSSIQRRTKGKRAAHNNGYGKGADGEGSDLAGLLQESRQVKQKITILKALDPDADDDDFKCQYKNALQDIEPGIDSSVPPLLPLREDALRASLIIRPPRALCVHLQRLHRDASGMGTMAKVMQRVRFDEVLDMAPYCAYYAGNLFEGRQTYTALMSYRLMSVIEHRGGAFGGHYQTYRRVGTGRDEWVLVSDESVSTRTWDDVRGCQAYMLFYVAWRQKTE